MNDQERQVIDDIFRRLEQVANQPRDPEAERHIAERLRHQPYAPYAMAQSIYVQEQALANLQAENERLRVELDQSRSRPQSGGFLSGLFGGGPRSHEPAYREPPHSGASPWGGRAPHQASYGAPQAGMMCGAHGGPWGGGMMQPRGGGGFLQGALSTAAGVAGGVMIANALSSAFGGSDTPAAGEKTALADTGGDQGGADASQASITDSLYPDNPGGQDDFSDFGSDGGDGGDWA